MSTPISEVYNMDCVQGLKHYTDNYFDLAIVDPPYGIGYSTRAGKQSGTKSGNAAAAKRVYTEKDWDNAAPDLEYFVELMRVSKNQIIWGANHFIDKIPYGSPCWIVWDKDNGTNKFADCELAWTSFKTSVRKFKWTWKGMIQQNMKNKEERIHPTQKPVKLYEWLLMNYAEKGFKILDTHLGSGSSRIDAHRMGFDFVAFELDQEYYNLQEKRFKDITAQIQLF
ncbi:DNA methyltransferase [Tenacibaculum maritimum]|nr:DNA methyltransferase [Tenacibaculum maritimum]MDB0613818.1 DNA methyltransferase [Tenacibaculum maritimum]